MAARFVAGALAFALGFVSLSVALRSPGYTFAGSALGATALLAAGWALAAAGLLHWSAGERNPTGLLLVAAGAAWFVAEWDSPVVGSSAVFTTGLAFQAACPALVAAAMFAYPRGRLGGWAARLVVGVLVAGTVVLLGGLSSMWYDPQVQGCRDCARNALLVGADPGRVVTLGRAGIRTALVSAVALVALGGWRLLRSSPAGRRAIGPVVLAGCVYFAAVAWAFAANADRYFVGSGSLERGLWFAQAGALGLVAIAVVWGRLRHERTRRSLVDIVIGLGKASTTGGLRDALSVRLDDPELQVAYAVDGGRWVDLAGADVDIVPSPVRASTPLVRDGTPVATIVHRPGILDDPDLVAEVASSARLLLDNERLQAAARANEADLRASQDRIVASGDAERRRLERDLHDGAQQRLVGLMLGIRLAGHEASADQEVRAALADTERALGSAVDSLRSVANGIHPGSLTAFGLAEALRSLGERSVYAVEVTALPPGRLPMTVETCAYHIVAEAAGTGEVAVAGSIRDSRLILDVEATRTPDALVDLEDRVGALDGHLRVVSAVASGRVVLRAEIPCAS